MDNQHIDIKEFLVIILRSENGFSMVLSCRMTLGNILDELIPTLLCEKSFTAVPAPSGMDLVTLPSLRESENHRMV